MKKKALCILLILIMTIAGSTVAFAEEPQIDYSQWDSQSAYPSDVVNTPLFTQVKFLVDEKIIEGYEDGLFHADRNITRAEYTKMMIIATNNQGNMRSYEAYEIFTDVTDHWAKGYINTAYQINLIKGVGDDKFAPDNSVTYAEVMAILIRTKGITDEQMAGYGEWPHNYATYSTTYNMLGLVEVSDWNAPATRGDVAQILYRNLPK